MSLPTRLFVGLLGFAAFAFLAACGSTKPPISVVVSAPTSQTDQGTTIFPITATLTNDTSGQGVNWSLTGVGSLSGTRGGSVTYAAPAPSNVTTVQTAKVTATSVADSSKSSSVTISVNPLPSFSSLSLPQANVGASYNQSIGIMGGTPPFNWVYGDGAVPAGTTFNTSTGTISGTPTAGGTWWFEVQMTDASGILLSFPFNIVVEQQVSGTNPNPYLTQPLIPTSMAPGGTDFTLSVHGTGFVSASTVDFDGSALATTFVNQGELQATVPASGIASAGTHSITVVSPRPGGGSSNVVYFPVATRETAPNFTNAPALPINTVYYELPAYVAAADFNHDGKTDLAVGYQTHMAVLLGNGDGTFNVASGSPFQLPKPPYANGLLSQPQSVGSLMVGDFFGSGHAGIAAAGYLNSTVYVFEGNGDGTLTLSPTAVFDQGANTLLNLAADFNGDGYPDLLVGSENISIVSLLGYGAGAFNIVPSSPFNAPSGCDGMDIGDFNGDGKLDFAVSLGGGMAGPAVGVEIFLGNGDGTFTQSGSALESGLQTGSIAVADFNGDGKLDLAFEAFPLNEDSNLYIMLGNGDGTFTAAPGSPIALKGLVLQSILVGDFLNHGKLDLLIGGYFLAGNGDGTFQKVNATYLSGNQAVVGDFNGSGRLGLAWGNLIGNAGVVIQP